MRRTPQPGHGPDTGYFTMPHKLTDAIIRALPTPVAGNRITYDTEVKGFGCRVTSAGVRSFILNYWTRGGRERRVTIGKYPEWKASAARLEAARLKRGVALGDDPLAAIEADRGAKTVANLAERFERDHLPKNREKTAVNYRVLLNRYILPELRHHKVAEITYVDIDDLHRKVTRAGAPYQANRAIAVLSKMLSLAVRWQWRPDNPAKGIERNPEVKRHRYLSGGEIIKLTAALSDLKDSQAAAIIRLLLLTGARSGEVMAARWDEFDLTNGVWTKPGSTTKQKTMHRVPLSAPARQLLAMIMEASGDAASDYVFPGRGTAHRVEIKNAWRDVCIAAGITIAENVNGRAVVRPSARIHDLRHTYASLLASANMSLPIIGALLGHSQPSTTARYSHLLDDPLRAATDRVGALVSPEKSGDAVVPLRGAIT
jgi:integrase